ncbi:MAG: DUF4239 domain-containing protein [Chloroflexota bacterium]
MGMGLFEGRQLAAIVLVLALVVAAVLLVRSRMARLLLQDADSVGEIAAAVIAIYGLILGLTLAAAWERYQRADEGLTTELNEMFVLTRQAYAWLGDGGEDLQQAVVDYGVAIGAHELTGQSADDINADIGREKLQEVYRIMARINAGPAGARGGIDPAWQTLGKLDEARGDRLTLTRIALPDQFWSVLYLGGLLSLLALVLIHPASQRLHIAITVSSAALIVLALILLRDLDAPFQGASTVDFEAFNHGVEVLARSISPAT